MDLDTNALFLSFSLCKSAMAMTAAVTVEHLLRNGPPRSLATLSALYVRVCTAA